MSEQDHRTNQDRAEALRQQGEDKLREGRDAARSALQEGQQKAGEILDDQKRGLAEQVNSVAKATRSAAEKLREENQGVIAGWIESAADGAETAAGNLRDRDLGDIYGQVTDFARRQPAVFIAGAALLGFAAARFAGASASHSYDQDRYVSDRSPSRPDGYNPAAPVSTGSPTAPAGSAYTPAAPATHTGTREQS
ncbi:hypothetical protein [Paracoccus sediminicola]|uniref:hypothetical protein n=1 Tax=Paracoccus sediminicola TaxID=3017783 RepID=UPI0022F13CFB|nr:hypothetical protein [Paracoccus sediminicola]WBU55700.1 hypothetical protein PAF18_09185 [Paracoccus sediminicola]